MRQPIPGANLATLLLWTARRHPDRPALIQGGALLTWRALHRRVSAAAAGLVARGVRPGDRVLVHAHNGFAMFETMWACWTIGAVWVPTNVRLSPAEVAYLAASSRAVAHVFGDFPDHAAAARHANASCRVTIALPGEWGAMATADATTDPADVAPGHPLWFFYTSGTTGHPKAAVLTHGQMGFVVNNHLADLLPGLSQHDASLVVAPLSHGAGIHAVVNVARGAATVLTESQRLDPEEAWRLVATHRISNMFTVPTILTALTRHDAVDRHDHASLRHVIYAGSPMYREDQRHALAKLGNVLVQYYGLGEVTGNITVLRAEEHSTDDGAMPVGSCGTPRTAMDVAILDDDGRCLPGGEDGEIAVRGGAVFAGYFENDEANAKAFAGGWFRTGDLGHLDDRGYLFITGRRSDMYISGGSNVYPREVEEALLTHPGVAEACVVGIPHPKWGECGVAVLVAREGATLDEAAVRAVLPSRLARYKWPERIVVWDALPRSGYGKVPKVEVRRRLLDDA